MNKRNLILGVCLMVVVLVVLLISANRNASMVLVTEESPIATKQPISRPVVDFTKGARYSGDDVYDPSINEFLWATLQACSPNFNGYDSYQPAVQLNCNAQASEVRSTPVVSSNDQ